MSTLYAYLFLSCIAAVYAEESHCVIPFPNYFADYKYCCAWPHWFNETLVKQCASDHVSPSDRNPLVNAYSCLSECLFLASDVLLSDGTLSHEKLMNWIFDEYNYKENYNEQTQLVHQVAAWRCSLTAVTTESFLNYEGCEKNIYAFLNCYEMMILYYCPREMKRANEALCYAYWRQMISCYLDRPNFAQNSIIKI